MAVLWVPVFEQLGCTLSELCPCCPLQRCLGVFAESSHEGECDGQCDYALYVAECGEVMPIYQSGCFISEYRNPMPSLL